MKDYLMLIRGGDARMATLSEEQQNAHMQDWGTYMNNLAEKGNLSGGLPLDRGGKLMTKEGAKDLTVGAGDSEIVGGYLMVKANDYDHAVELAKDCPVFEMDGNIEIREAVPM